MNTVEIGKRIKDKRNKLGLTQAMIYDKTGISTGNLSDIERGKSAPSASALCELSKILECSVDYILFSEEVSDVRENLTSLQNNILVSLNELDLIEQEEILDIIEMKIRRKKRLAKSSVSEVTATSETA